MARCLYDSAGGRARRGRDWHVRTTTRQQAVKDARTEHEARAEGEVLPLHEHADLRLGGQNDKQPRSPRRMLYSLVPPWGGARGSLRI